jgi:hypothetical protein
MKKLKNSVPTADTYFRLHLGFVHTVVRIYDIKKKILVLTLTFSKTPGWGF